MAKQRGGVLDVIVVALAVGVALMFFVPQKQFDRAFYWLTQAGLVAETKAEPTVVPFNQPVRQTTRSSTVISVPRSEPVAVPEQVSAPQLPFCEDVDSTTTACQWRVNPADAVPDTVVWNSRTMPRDSKDCDSGRFYTCAEVVQMDREESERFYNPETLPTPPPEFVEYANKACAEAAVKSPLCP